VAVQTSLLSRAAEVAAAQGGPAASGSSAEPAPLDAEQASQLASRRSRQLLALKLRFVTGAGRGCLLLRALPHAHPRKAVRPCPVRTLGPVSSPAPTHVGLQDALEQQLLAHMAQVSAGHTSSPACARPRGPWPPSCAPAALQVGGPAPGLNAELRGIPPAVHPALLPPSVLANREPYFNVPAWRKEPYPPRCGPHHHRPGHSHVEISPICVPLPQPSGIHTATLHPADTSDAALPLDPLQALQAAVVLRCPQLGAQRAGRTGRQAAHAAAQRPFRALRARPRPRARPAHMVRWDTAPCALQGGKGKTSPPASVRFPPAA
jgi:hypothetical protein